MHLLNNIRVIDGDTYEGDVNLIEHYPKLKTTTQTILRKKIRLHYVDTPETRGAYLEEEETLGKKIKDLVELIFTTAKEIHVEPTGITDSFGRIVGEVWVTDSGGTYALSEFLLDHKLAVLYGYSDRKDWINPVIVQARIDECEQLINFVAQQV